MADEYFEYFLTKFPLSTSGPACTDEHVRDYTGLVPDCLISYWQEYGFSGVGNGIAWLVDPIEWKVTADEVLLDTLRHPRLDENALYIPFLRSAFGKTFFWTPGYGMSITVEPARGSAFFWAPPKDSSPQSLERAMQAFFTAARKDQFDFRGRDEEPMFDRVYEHLGPLQFDEVYGFAPGLRIGGAAVVESTHLFQIHVHMAFLRTAIGDDWYVAG
ncbi:GAD-like domain-containing protein [Mycobacteroides abscessus]|uniref:GAD-like domain-containing protein n=1 Tax=Mycobacteroides abscessus TaxID=36809 RepID=UPI0009A667CA|nr:GAD-like domain-containing protein [Mycobacteroides abscessus]SKF79496.1 GAD-like domain-containing protein [Mycobacteroides abscessus subsp. bolletii]SKG56592.1 GAD-like domain-containing protein [Mycobacteroides abscessus subsp. bolletii]SKG83263.1 GAD-like domain-containing protein [Mycobacteroides abscessus subsp. bolletii]SKG94062.1 GAD-like domain-containing protein [Mycobacteroides abscessus subsp. bolletii]SKH25944.1 GAD-like domain-containing protein [Mycobacteroides abscessus subs